jgi:hypothetical protein
MSSIDRDLRLLNPTTARVTPLDSSDTLYVVYLAYTVKPMDRNRAAINAARRRKAKDYENDTDASKDAIGAVLSQEINGAEIIIAYGRKTLTKTERKYCVTRKELLAIVYFVKHFRHFLYGKTFTYCTSLIPLASAQVDLLRF